MNFPYRELPSRRVVYQYKYSGWVSTGRVCYQQITSSSLLQVVTTNFHCMKFSFKILNDKSSMSKSFSLLVFCSCIISLLSFNTNSSDSLSWFVILSIFESWPQWRNSQLLSLLFLWPLSSNRHCLLCLLRQPFLLHDIFSKSSVRCTLKHWSLNLQ